LKKDRLYISELIEDPVVSYPAWYPLSPRLHADERLREALAALHSNSFEEYSHPDEWEGIFRSISSGEYPIYHETYIIGRFGGRLMYLDRSGWHSMSVTEEIFDMRGWLVRL